MSVDEVLVCDCGFEARAADEEALVEQVRRHASETHGMALSHDDALAIARKSAARMKKEEEE
jgi:predicted small metal-binding protein